MRFVLASKSPARLAVLSAAGLTPEVIVSGVDEDALLATIPDASPAEKVSALAQAKATAIAAQLDDGIIVGCDSMFEQDGEVRGKPADADDAITRLKQMRGRSGVLHTGHCVINKTTGAVAIAAAQTTVYISDLSDDEIAAYVGTGEPLHVAGSFTIDGLGGWFIDRLEGDHTNVIGISLPLLRSLLRDVGVHVSDILNQHQPTGGPGNA